MAGQLVFISYSHKDISFVKQLVELLHEAGYTPWFDPNLTPGKDWKTELSQVIEECDALLYVMTPEATQSEYCLWELNHAIASSTPIIPIRLQKDISPPEEIASIQWVDFTEGMTIQNTARLTRGLRTIIGNKPQSTTAHHREKPVKQKKSSPSPSLEETRTPDGKIRLAISRLEIEQLPIQQSLISRKPQGEQNK